MHEKLFPNVLTRTIAFVILTLGQKSQATSAGGKDKQKSRVIQKGVAGVVF